MDLLRLGRGLLVPAAVVFALRSLLHLMGDDPGGIPLLGPVTGLSGALSLAGIILVLVAAWKTDGRGLAIIVAACIGVGHYVFSPLMPDVGAAFVYFGTGLAAGAPWGLLAGFVAMLGALMRGDAEGAHLLVVVGSAATAALLVRALRRGTGWDDRKA